MRFDGMMNFCPLNCPVRDTRPAAEVQRGWRRRSLGLSGPEQLGADVVIVECLLKRTTLASKVLVHAVRSTQVL
jgi:hypothetical protein